MRIVYIAGPITGIDDYRERFARAEAQVRERKGVEAVLNPAVLPGGLPQEAYMPICLDMLQQADTICLMPGWRASPGANMERRFAEYQGKDIVEL